VALWPGRRQRLQACRLWLQSFSEEEHPPGLLKFQQNGWLSGHFQSPVGCLMRRIGLPLTWICAGQSLAVWAGSPQAIQNKALGGREDEAPGGPPFPVPRDCWLPPRPPVPRVAAPPRPFAPRWSGWRRAAWSGLVGRGGGGARKLSKVGRDWFQEGGVTESDRESKRRPTLSSFWSATHWVGFASLS
jgi:hypothetical protein